jgi:CheY-like chemotaxis protein
MKTVLMVEDQLEFRAIHSSYLQLHGYHVLVADDGGAAVHTARRERPDLILMDYSIPVMNGLEAVRQLKEDPATAGIPVLLLTAHTYGAVGRRAKEAGCDGYLAKPVEPRRVLQEVQRRIGN